MNMLEAIQVFVEVVNHGNFTKAAQANHLHRPAVTKAIQRLEHELGVQLLRRTTRKQSLTEEGEIFYERCAKMLADLAETVTMFSPSRAPKGCLRLDMPGSVAKAVVVPALPEFRRLFPEIELVIRSSDAQVDLVSEGVDCAIRLGELGDSSLIARRIGHLPMVTCGSPRYLDARGIPESMDDLDNHVAVNFLLQHSQRILDWQFEVGGELVTKSMHGDVVVDDAETFLTCGLVGLGLIQGLRPALQPYIHSGELVEILHQIKVPSKPMSVVITDRRHRTQKVDVFIRWLEELLAERALT